MLLLATWYRNYYVIPCKDQDFGYYLNGSNLFKVCVYFITLWRACIHLHGWYLLFWIYVVQQSISNEEEFDDSVLNMTQIFVICIIEFCDIILYFKKVALSACTWNRIHYWRKFNCILQSAKHQGKTLKISKTKSKKLALKVNFNLQ